MRTAELRAVYAGSYPRLVVQLYALLDDLDEAQACVQDTFLRVLGRPRALDEVTDPETYLRTAALARSRRRTLLRRRPRTTAQPVALSLGPRHAALLQALSTLPDDQRRVVALHRLGDLPLPEVAQTLGVATGTVRERLAQADARLAELLADESDRA